MLDGPTYIGDGVYAGFDGYQFWLRTERESGWHEIALEPGVVAAFLDYRKRVYEAAKIDDNK